MAGQRRAVERSPVCHEACDTPAAALPRQGEGFILEELGQFEATLSVILPVMHILIGVICVMHILGSRKRASPTILWILTVIYLPWIGALLYLIFGVNTVNRRIEKRQQRRERLPQSLEVFTDQSERVVGEAWHEHYADRWPKAFHEFFRLLDNLTAFEGVDGNRCKLMCGGEAVYAAMEQAINEAKSSIHLMTYIVDDDEVGRSLFDRLAAKARQGVEVRALVDGYGSNMFAWRQVGRYRRSGVDLRLLRQFHPLRGRFAINLRNHRKIMVIDGLVAFTGGMNISARHLLEPAKSERVIDYHCQIEGPVVGQLQRIFAEDWFDVTSESIAEETYFPDVEPVGDDIVRAISGGPDDRRHSILKAFCAAIQTAGESIDIVTPYFVPDPAILMLLKLAALGDVRTRIVVPTANNHPEIKLASRYRYIELMRVGVEIYERSAPFSHSKLYLIDDLWACVGSANWDMRTFHLQFDTNVGVVSPEFVRQVKDSIEDEIAVSKRIELKSFAPRPRLQGAAERFCSLFEDLL